MSQPRPEQTVSAAGPLAWRKVKIICSVIVCGIAMIAIAIWMTRTPRAPEVSYKGKSLSEWFYGGRTNFLMQNVREDATAACKASGTNAMPFLLRNLSAKGDSALYFKFYRSLPKALQRRLPYPVSGDDVCFLTLDTIRQMNDLPNTALAAVAERVPRLTNPKLRRNAISCLDLSRHRRWRDGDEVVVKLCRTLLHDPVFGVRVQAASTLVWKDVNDPKIAPILVEALKDEPKLKAAQALNSYWFGQPPGAPAPLPLAGGGPNPAKQLRMTQQMIARALVKIQPNLNEEQKALVRKFKTVEQ